VLLALHELTTNASTVLIADFVHLDGVITAEERDDELTSLIIGLSANEFSIEAEDVHVLFEDFLHVDLRSLRVQGKHTVHRVLFSAVASVVWHSLVHEVWCCFFELHWVLGDAKVLDVPGLSEIVTVIDKAFASIQDELISAHEILRSIVVLVAERHAGADRENRRLSELLSLQKHREGVASTVLLSNLLYLNGVV